jgi:polyphosphate kinase
MEQKIKQDSEVLEAQQCSSEEQQKSIGKKEFRNLVKENHLDRDISWMYFNHRILQEAEKESVPLLERLKFLGIYSNNLDEFFRVRMACLSKMAENKDKDMRKERHTAETDIAVINKLNTAYAKEYELATNEIWNKLKQQNIVIVSDKNLNVVQQHFVVNYYKTHLSGLLSPIWLSSIERLDKSVDEGTHLVVKMLRWNAEKSKAKKDYALVNIPTAEVRRFLLLPDSAGKKCLIYLDDVIRYCLPLIFIGERFDSFEAYSFKFTRNAELAIDTDLQQGVLQKLTKGLKSRKRGEPLRVLYDEEMPKDLLKVLMGKLHLNSLDTVLASGRYHNHKDLMMLPDCARPDLEYPQRQPMMKAELDTDASLISLIQQHDRFIHVPYHSFDSYLRLLNEAALNRHVTSIKTTLYRLAKDSKVIKALICAARNGKKVLVVIELLARFDEEENMDWSKKMEEAGIQVLFGLDGLKVHSKLTYIATETGDIACISTGNFHEGNAKVYTDYTLMTARKSIVHDVENVFDFIRKPYASVKFKELLLSPLNMRERIIELLDTEIKNAHDGKPAYFMGKMNHITDEEIVDKLYEAAAAGVRIDLLVRGNCSLVTGVPGLSDNIRICGIIDRYLEHSRILIFANGGSERYFIGSADWMPRNFDSRVEAMVPVYDFAIQQDLKRTVVYGLRDNQQGRVVDGTGRNLPWNSSASQPFNSQTSLYNAYKHENELYVETMRKQAKMEEPQKADDKKSEPKPATEPKVEEKKAEEGTKEETKKGGKI